MRFPLFFDTMISNAEFESNGVSTNSLGPETRRKLGLGKGAAVPSIALQVVRGAAEQFFFHDRHNNNSPECAFIRGSVSTSIFMGSFPTHDPPCFASPGL